jgi:hypothetical protein
MRSFTAAATLGLAAAALVSAAPTTKPIQSVPSKHIGLPDGFPFPNAQQLDKIEDDAFGTLSNAAPPPSLKEDTFTSVRLIALNENVEVFFFDELIRNITLNRPGYDHIPNRSFVLNSLKAIRAQEELHSINANKALKHFGKDPIRPCRYNFPVDNFEDAIAFASRITDFVQGVLGDVITKAGGVGDAGFTRGVAGALSNEGEQDGWFRTILGERPSQKPFNTISTREYAFSLLQDVTVPGSCPDEAEIDLPVFQPLSAADPSAKTQDLEFTFSLKPTRQVPSKQNSFQIQPLSHTKNFAQKYGKNWRKLSVSYLNGQDAPISTPVKHLKIHGETVTVTAEFPFDEFKMFGLSIAALTVGDKFADSDAMVKATLFAPALLETKE